MALDFRKPFTGGLTACGLLLASCGSDEPQLSSGEVERFAAAIGNQRAVQVQSTAEAFTCSTPQPELPPVGTIDSAAIPLVRADLRTVPPTVLPFTPVEIASGFTYLYGIETADYDCDGEWDVSLFNSWTGLSPDPRGAVGFNYSAAGGLEQITDRDTWPGLIQTGLYLFERHKALDINGDGFLDIVGAGNSNEAFIAYLNPGATDPAARWERRYLHTFSPGPINLAIHDMDGDGLEDVVISLRINSGGPANAVGGLGWLKNPGPQSSERWLKRTIGPSDDLLDPRNLHVADFDGNGHPDVYVSDARTGLASTYFQTPAGTWERDRIAIGSINGHFGAAIDEQNDGVPEIVQPIFQGIRYLRFDETARSWTFQTIASFTIEENPLYIADIALSDMDRDGLTDIVFSVGSLSTSATAPRRGGIFLMRAANNWQVEAVAQATSSVVELKLVDFDRDGDTDIVANFEYPENKAIIYYRN
ncbi:VCBS repeat-containing protein [Erythrobacter sp. JK5]|uniref:FG-GAP repeat domain-containing protein n=1 Tax=Erythrobacter sp. JK5 TaxID=2829500 RepID=UPI001BAC61CF|nr:VCBS repeat-containing protein [Erythrobacter sp. JK5]QUL37880.1 VCBS repeat-containing protein [Erythrobacter sp. JK5]